MNLALLLFPTREIERGSGRGGGAQPQLHPAPLFSPSERGGASVANTNDEVGTGTRWGLSPLL